MTEFWVCFSCCIAEQPQPKRRRRIDRSMIGAPTNFVHTTHVGSGDVGLGFSIDKPPKLSSHDHEIILTFTVCWDPLRFSHQYQAVGAQDDVDDDDDDDARLQATLLGCQEETLFASECSEKWINSN
ncbi:CDC42 small effector protein 2 [Arapaima gigas]